MILRRTRRTKSARGNSLSGLAATVRGKTRSEVRVADSYEIRKRFSGALMTRFPSLHPEVVTALDECLSSAMSDSPSSAPSVFADGTVGIEQHIAAAAKVAARGHDPDDE